ncbi:electron transfer flavoprotein subunit alpha/FixB family protein [Ohessyouella blattaphilus]|uniref:Electron transfer flavoprotein subunit alpha/FixB family protein n=1 Tax=Ohessyouella blattaphilus TaxID=2949333 RepID=A0ABT1EH21_9FIRM|nr:electron transfer flavoprotein subunit alpha/FixB family protein [Ohessyouella blattaphilus]MCP1109789.1 electron transfer flavoprotein subunit alpha/FixB family protein [Ohessyouella blattaphilus]MCR8563183.1 electron transfer flavoprotein subunit alpha/FixB family protein [Ohessyouella blattaphilus]
MTKGRGIFVFLECTGNRIEEVSLELLAKACELQKLSQEPLYGVAIGKEGKELETQLLSLPVEKLWWYRYDGACLPALWEEAVLACIEEVLPSVLLLGGTPIGSGFASRVAVAMKTGVTADCTMLELDEGGNLIQTRPAFGGNIMASILTEKTRPQIATVRQGIFPVLTKKHQQAEMVKRRLSEQDSGVRLLKREEKSLDGGITKQEILVVAGRGVKREDDLEQLRELAHLLGGELASSRALVEKGWMPQSTQIGLSGNVVSPQVILTLGVSGTIQFMTGMKNAKKIIAVNTDKEAPIFSIAHFPIVGDLYTIVPNLLTLLKERE